MHVEATRPDRKSCAESMRMNFPFHGKLLLPGLMEAMAAEASDRYR
jgi:hypothetical protein